MWQENVIELDPQMGVVYWLYINDFTFSEGREIANRQITASFPILISPQTHKQGKIMQWKIICGGTI